MHNFSRKCQSRWRKNFLKYIRYVATIPCESVRHKSNTFYTIIVWSGIHECNECISWQTMVQPSFLWPSCYGQHRPTNSAINWSVATLHWSGLWDVISLQTLCWEIGDKSGPWNNSTLHMSSITFTETSIDETNKTQQKVTGSKIMFKMSNIHANTCIQTTTPLCNRCRDDGVVQQPPAWWVSRVRCAGAPSCWKR